MKRIAMLIVLVVLLGHTVQAAWPDIYPSRVSAMEALRHDLIMPDLRRDEEAIAARYAVACRKGFANACQPEWAGDLDAAAAFFRRQCSYEPLACTVMGWSTSRVDGAISPYASDPAEAARLFEAACNTDLYAPACTSLGELYLHGAGVTPSASSALAFFQEGCQARDYWGCYQQGALLLSEAGAAPDASVAAEAAVLLKSACDNQIVQACAALGHLLERGAGIARDLPAAAALHSQGCEAGLVDSCYSLGDLYAEGRGVVRSGAMALGLYRASCEAGDLRGCYGEGVLFATGEGVAQNIESAIRKFDRVCEAGYAPGCSRLGVVYFHGQGAQRDRRLGMRYLHRGCDAGDPYGCEELGAALVQGGRDIEPDPMEAARVLHLSCEGGSGRACGLMAGLYESGALSQGDRTPTDLHTLACERAYGESCRWLAEHDTDAARDWYHLGCQADDGRSCGQIGQIALAANDREAAGRWLQQACQLNDHASCTAAGRLFEEQRALIEALALYERGCEQGYTDACDAAAPITFEARHREVLRLAFSSSICQLWRIDPENPSQSEILVEADGPLFKVHAGIRAGSEATAWHIDERIDVGAVWFGRSRWSIGGGDATDNAWLSTASTDAPVWPPPATPATPATSAWERQDRYWEIAVELYETWDNTQSIETFPGPDSFATDQDATNAIAYSREDGSIRRRQPGRCQFIGATEVLGTEHCSEVQALLAATLVTSCD